MNSVVRRDGSDWRYCAGVFDSQGGADIGDDSGIRCAKALQRCADAGEVAFDFDLVQAHAEPCGGGLPGVENFIQNQTPQLWSKVGAVGKVAHRSCAIFRQRLAGLAIEQAEVPKFNRADAGGACLLRASAPCEFALPRFVLWPGPRGGDSFLKARMDRRAEDDQPHTALSAKVKACVEIREPIGPCLSR